MSDLGAIGERKPPHLELGQFWRYDGQIYCFRPSCEGCKWDSSCQREEVEIKVGSGLNIRKAFKAPPGYKLVSVDYKGIELRIAAQLSGEPVFVKAFQEGRDLHKDMAKICFKTNDPTKEQRDQAKCCNFGNLYLGTPYTLARQSDLTLTQAIFIHGAWWKNLPIYKLWTEKQLVFAKEHKFIQTFFQRRRDLSDMIKRAIEEEATGKRGKGKSGWDFIHRTATNSPIQGCLRPEVRVLTENGYETISSLYEQQKLGVLKQKVWTGNKFASFSVVNRGKAKYVDLYIKRRGFLACDDRHKIKVATEEGWVWKGINDLKIGDKVAIARPVSVKNERKPDVRCFSGVSHNAGHLKIDFSTPDWFYLMGFILGDGCFGKNKYGHRINLLIEDSNEGWSYARKVESILVSVGLVSKPNWVRNDPEKNRRQWAFDSKPLGEALVKFGMIPNSGARNKFIPEYCYTASYESRCALLQGLFHTDGTKLVCNRGWHSSSLSLVRGIYLILRTIGVDSRYSQTQQGTWKLDIVSKGLFAEKMGLPYGTVRRDAGGPSVLSFQMGEAYRSLKDLSLDKSEVVIRSRLKQGGTTQITTLARMVKTSLGRFLPNEFHFYDEVEDIKYLGEEGDTYTLSVDDSYHQFDSEGVISKNTGADLLKIGMIKVHDWIMKNFLQERVKMILTVHDELVFYVKEDGQLFSTCREIQRCMCPDLSSWGWNIPLETDCEIGDNWALLTDIKKLDKSVASQSILNGKPYGPTTPPDNLLLVVNAPLTEINRLRLDYAIRSASHQINFDDPEKALEVMMPLKLKIQGQIYRYSVPGTEKLRVREFQLRHLLREIPGVSVEEQREAE